MLQQIKKYRILVVILISLVVFGFGTSSYLVANYTSIDDSAKHEISGHPSLRREVVKSSTIQTERAKQLDRIEDKLVDIEKILLSQ